MASKITGYINPFSAEQAQARKDFPRLSISNRIVAVVLTALAGLVSAFLGGILGCAVFRALVNHYKPIKAENNPTVQKTDEAAASLKPPVQEFKENIPVNIPVPPAPNVPLNPPAPVEVISPIHQPRGINNIGNSCYINSTLQVLFHTGLSDYIDIDPPVPEVPENDPEMIDYQRKMAHLRALREVKRVYAQGGDIAAAVLQLRAVAWGMDRLDADFDPQEQRISSQQDARAFLGVVLQAIGYECRQVAQNSAPGVDPSRNVEPLLMISAGVNGNNIEQVLQGYRREEVNDPENGWGNIHNYTREMFITGAIPDTLVVHLKRFETEPIRGGNGAVRGIKIQNPVEIPDEIDLANMMDPELIREGVSTRYRVKAYINHHGDSINGGHYTANVRKEDGWYQCNDSGIRKLEIDYEDRVNAYIVVLERIV